MLYLHKWACVYVRVCGKSVVWKLDLWDVLICFCSCFNLCRSALNLLGFVHFAIDLSLVSFLLGFSRSLSFSQASFCSPSLFTLTKVYLFYPRWERQVPEQNDSELLKATTKNYKEIQPFYILIRSKHHRCYF